MEELSTQDTALWFLLSHPPFAILPWLQMESFAPIVGVINNHPYASSASVVLACATLVHSARWYPRTRLPPGPKGYPIVGNLFDLPPTHVWEKLGAWGKQYGQFSFPRSHPPWNSRLDMNLD